VPTGCKPFAFFIATLIKKLNMIRKITADYVLPISQAAIPQGVVVFEAETGEILSVSASRADFEPTELEHFTGAIIPGFVNAHCHLELSHMLGRVSTGTGLLDFIGQVVSGRNLPPEVIAEAIAQADLDMQKAGIVAVGDISNTVDTFATKAKSAINYYTFVECFDFWQLANAESEFAKYNAVFQALKPAAHQRKSLVPHAPYSVSPSLFALINAENDKYQAAPRTISIHNQETGAENALFMDKNSDFIDFFGKFGFHFDALTEVGKTAIHYALQQLPKADRWLFVHNTLTTADDLRAANAVHQQNFWATCPNANLYIENRLPNYKIFMEAGAKVCIGTDSLTSNWQLSVLEELKTIAKYQSFVPTPTLLAWATLNGAEALGFADSLGSIERGKRCGLNLLNLGADLQINHNTTVQKLA
jgi:cytosine/adenosine deaminase-related metal-dependent hydrolase